jgi:hypothetical protein
LHNMAVTCCSDLAPCSRSINQSCCFSERHITERWH